MQQPLRNLWMLSITMISLVAECWTGCRAGQPPPIFQNIRTAAFSTDGTLLAVLQGDESDIALINTASGRTLSVLKGCGCTVDMVMFSPDNEMVITYAIVCSGDSYFWEAKLWDVKTGHLRQTLAMRDIGPVKIGPYALGFTADGHLAAATDGDSFVRLWSIATGKRTGLALRSQFFFSSDGAAVPMTAALTFILTQFPPTTPLQFCTFSFDEHLLLTISGKNTVNGLVSVDDGPGKAAVLWDAVTGKQLRTFPLDGHSAYSGSIRGGKVVVGGEDYARAWSLSGGPSTELWHEASSADKFDWFGHSYVELARLTQGDEVSMIAVKLKPYVNKNPRERSPLWYTYELRFVRVDAAKGNKTSAFILTGQ